MVVEDSNTTDWNFFETGPSKLVSIIEIRTGFSGFNHIFARITTLSKILTIVQNPEETH